jgi:hypothetical protein
MRQNAKIATVLLLKGMFYKSDNELAWLELVEGSRGVIDDYFETIGLSVERDEAEGYAYLKNIEFEEESEALPKLITSRELSYKVSLLCVLLRKKMVDFEMQSDSQKAVVTKEDIINEITLFLPQKFNEVKSYKEIEATIKKVEDLGFLKKLKSTENSYEIKSAIKAFIDAQWLNEFNEKLEEYKEQKWS